jgi:large subunit ribosomal protein L1|tara:strand:+ start:130 stop:819 length:690 start_codon:yes stop_codon:yes gene_type:complete
MKKYTKRIGKLHDLIQEESYSAQDASKLLKELATAKFDESVEAHISLNIDPKYANQQLRTTLVLPHGTGKSIKIAVFTDTDDVQTALDAGADIAGADDLLEDMSGGNLDFDILVTTPQLMPKLAKLGRVLGPKGLMPSPKSGTVTQDIEGALSEFKKGKLEYRADKTGIVHLSFGKASFSESQIQENLTAVFESIEKNKPSGVKGRYFKSFNVCTTMSPALRIELASFK